MSKRFLVTISQFIEKINLSQSDHVKWLKQLCLEVFCGRVFGGFGFFFKVALQ